jgi:hAT family C-terminal dimerisation region
MADRHNFDLLEYWRVHSTRFPNLSRMARDYLAVPGTSTPTERVFSFSAERQWKTIDY